jgi:hypothetical protein
MTAILSRPAAADVVAAMMPLPRPLLLALILCCLLPGCSSERDPARLFDDYLWRLGNVTTVDVEPAVARPFPLPPRLAERRLAVREFDVGLLDMVALQRCGLGDLVGQRNSSLGRVMRNDALLNHELRFLARVPGCISGEQAIESGELRDTLAAAAAGKRADLPRRMWNAVFADPDSRLLSAAPPLTTGGDERLDAALQSLRDLESLYRRVLAEPTALSETDLADLQRTLQRLAQNESLGAVTAALRLSTASLGEGTRLLQQARQNAPFCPQGRSLARAEHMHNVFLRTYVAEVQPYLGRLYRDGSELLRLLQRIDAIADGLHGDAWLDWRRRQLSLDHEQAEWQRFRRALHDHTRTWQVVLEDCGLRPGA